MNLLQIVNTARVECGVSGPALATVAGTTGEAARFVNWAQQAWTELQALHPDWQWMRADFAFDLTPSTSTYSVAATGLTDFANWIRDSFRCSTDDTYVDEQLLHFMPWSTFRNLYLYANMRNTYSRPVVVTVRPDKALAFGPGPSLAYRINGEYYHQPTTLAIDADAPEMPDHFHQILVYDVMRRYGAFEAAPEVAGRGNGEFNKMMSRLSIDQLPVITSGAPLA